MVFKRFKNISTDFKLFRKIAKDLKGFVGISNIARHVSEF